MLEGLSLRHSIIAYKAYIAKDILKLFKQISLFLEENIHSFILSIPNRNKLKQRYSYPKDSHSALLINLSFSSHSDSIKKAIIKYMKFTSIDMILKHVI